RDRRIAESPGVPPSQRHACIVPGQTARHRPRLCRGRYDTGMAKKLSHLDGEGRARMVDVGGKPAVRRVATAVGRFVAQKATLDRVMTGDLPKGEALATARIAGIAAAKRTHEWVPLCHTLPLEAVNIDFERVDDTTLLIRATASVTAKTGVEMEALVAVSAAALTLYDMTK